MDEVVAGDSQTENRREKRQKGGFIRVGSWGGGPRLTRRRSSTSFSFPGGKRSFHRGWAQSSLWAQRNPALAAPHLRRGAHNRGDVGFMSRVEIMTMEAPLWAPHGLPLWPPRGPRQAHPPAPRWPSAPRFPASRRPRSAQDKQLIQNNGVKTLDKCAPILSLRGFILYRSVFVFLLHIVIPLFLLFLFLSK